MTNESSDFPPLHPLKQALRNVLVPFGSTRIGGWIVLKWITPIDQFLMKASNARISIVELTYPSLLLTTIGAKSGQPRSVPLIYLREGGDYVVIASAAGQARHPGWYYNLRANPEATILFNATTLKVRAREATGEQREQIWARATRYYPGFAAYKKRASHREIAVFLLTPER